MPNGRIFNSLQIFHGMECPFCGFKYLIDVNVGQSTNRRNINLGFSFLSFSVSTNLLRETSHLLSFKAEYCSNCKRIYTAWKLNDLNNIDLDISKLNCRILKCYVVIPILSIYPFQRYKKDIAKHFSLNVTDVQDPLIIIIWCRKNNDGILIRQLRGYYDMNAHIIRIADKGYDNLTSSR